MACILGAFNDRLIHHLRAYGALADCRAKLATWGKIYSFWILVIISVVFGPF